jgi:hypothetical protein
MIQQEGAILASVGSYSDASVTCEIARCQLDGIANALIWMQGAKETAAFVFALSDRVAGGVRDVTDCWSPVPVKVIEHEPVEPAKGFRRAAKALDRFYYGFLCGMAVMVVVTALGRM